MTTTCRTLHALASEGLLPQEWGPFGHHSPNKLGDDPCFCHQDASNRFAEWIRRREDAACHDVQRFDDLVLCCRCADQIPSGLPDRAVVQIVASALSKFRAQYADHEPELTNPPWSPPNPHPRHQEVLS